MAEVKRLMTPPFRVSFPHVFQAASYNGGEPRYSVQAVWEPATFNEAGKKLWKQLKTAMNEEAQNRFKKSISDFPANMHRGLRDGQEKAQMDGYGEGKVFSNITTKIRPGVVNAKREDLGPEHGNADELYPGCYARATVGVYSYDNKQKGVAIGLLNLQKVKDGERLDSRKNAAEDFDDIEIDDEGGEEGDGALWD